MLDTLTEIKLDFKTDAPRILLYAKPVSFKNNEINIKWAPKYIAVKNSEDIKEAYIKLLEILLEEARK